MSLPDFLGFLLSAAVLMSDRRYGCMLQRCRTENVTTTVKNLIEQGLIPPQGVRAARARLGHATVEGVHFGRNALTEKLPNVFGTPFVFPILFRVRVLAFTLASLLSSSCSPSLSRYVTPFRFASSVQQVSALLQQLRVLLCFLFSVSSQFLLFMLLYLSSSLFSWLA